MNSSHHARFPQTLVKAIQIYPVAKQSKAWGAPPAQSLTLTFYWKLNILT